MAVYGYFIENAISYKSNDLLLEFNIKDSLEKIIQNIKKYIIKLIDKATDTLNKCKDNKLKSSDIGLSQHDQTGVMIKYKEN